MKMLKISLFFGISIAIVANTAALINYGECASPSNEPGLCLHIADCQFLYSMLLSTTINGKDKDHLQRSQCGYDNTQKSTDRRVLVCCPHKYCKDADNSAVIDKIQPGNILPEAGICGSVLSNRILGGNVTTLNEFPWMALIEYKKPNNQFGFHCGGTLINSRYVLTASHCVRNSLPEPWIVHSVRLGEWNLDTNPDCDIDIRGKNECAPPHIDVPIERVIAHPHYQPESLNQFHDIALLRTARSIMFTDFIKPICLPVSVQLRETNFKAMEVAGWGLTEKNSPSAKLLKITVQNWDIADCQTSYKSFQRSINGTMQFCAGGSQGIDTCRGDSGGPLMVSEQVGNRMIFFQAGIVSYGPKPCGLKGWPGVYTRTGCYIDWIQSSLEP